MMIDVILSMCDERWSNNQCGYCIDCSYNNYCPHDCGKSLDYIHTPNHAPNGAPKRKYDCVYMADYYTCKYSCRYTSEIIYAIRQLKDINDVKDLRVLSFGCGPCTDLFAIDYLRNNNEIYFNSLEYRGVDYSYDVWRFVHHDIKSFETNNLMISFYYQDACDLINDIANGSWIPNLIVFQYVFSDMRKHTDHEKISFFISTFAKYYNSKVLSGAYVVLNDINLGINYNGGREYFDQIYAKLENSIERKGYFRNETPRGMAYPHGYPYGEGEFPCNKNLFDLRQWRKYSPFNTCASAQMLIKKR